MNIAFGILLGLIPFTLMGLTFFFLVFVRSKREPMDTSNRIGHLRLVWFALKSPEKFVPLLYKVRRREFEIAFPWLTKDEGDIVDGAI